MVGGALDVGKIELFATFPENAKWLVCLLDREYQNRNASKRIHADSRITSRARIKYIVRLRQAGR